MRRPGAGLGFLERVEPWRDPRIPKAGRVLLFIRILESCLHGALWARSESRRDEGLVAPGDRTPHGVREPGVGNKREQRAPWRGEGPLRAGKKPIAPPRGSPMAPTPGSLTPCGVRSPGATRPSSLRDSDLAMHTRFRDTYKKRCGVAALLSLKHVSTLSLVNIAGLQFTL